MNIASVFQAAATLAWILTFAVIALAVVRAGQKRPLKSGLTTVVVMLVLAIVLTVTSLGLVFIRPQERGVVISAVSEGGIRLQPLNSGVHWIFPILETVERYSIARETYTMSIAPSEGEIQGDDSIAARTADGQEIYVDASVIYSIDPAKVVQVHIAWQDRYAVDLVRPQTRGIIRDAVSQFGVEEVNSTKRQEFVQMIEEILSEKLADNGILLIDFVLRNITFSPEYAASVEQKQISEQQAQQAALIVEQRKQEAEQARQVAQGRADAAVIAAQGAAEGRIIEAQAEAEALRLIAEAIQDNPDLLTYQYISKLSPNIQTMLLPANAPFIFPFPEVGPAPASSASPAVPEPTPLPTTTP
jgi:regulator of protease activity HflC (stomatin/prohibitin superfamily)